MRRLIGLGLWIGLLASCAVPGGAQASGASPSSVAFGYAPLNTTVTRDVTITVDAGYKTTVVSGTGLNAPFSFAFDTCGAGGGFTGPGTCNVKQSFKPTALTGSIGTTNVLECPVAGGSCIAIPYAVAGTGVRDATPPVISIASPLATTYTQNQVVNADYSCSDADSAVASCIGPVPNGGRIDTSSPGVYAWTVTASDSDRNSGSETRMYRVVESPASNVVESPASKADTEKPTLGPLTLSPSVFKAAKSGASVSIGKKSKAKVGTKVSYRLSEASTVTFAIERKTNGQKVAGRCKPKRKNNAGKTSCTRWVKVNGSFILVGKPGKNGFTFRGRAGGKSLKPGGYRLSGKATDPAKNESAPKRKAFTIIK